MKRDYAKQDFLRDPQLLETHGRVEKETAPAEPSADYPLGGSVEPHDIERDNSLIYG